MDKDDPYLRPVRPVSAQEQKQHIYVPPIEPDKHIVEDQQNIKAPLGEKKHSIVSWASLMEAIKNFITRLSFRQENVQAAVSPKDPLRTYLVDLKDTLYLLTDCDHSEDIPFSQRLSHLWHNIIEEVQDVKTGKSRSSIDQSRLDMLITEIQFFPPAEEHNLGYYLIEYAGEDWYPFPYMELIRRIHKDYLDAPSSSLLNTWLEQLTLLTK